MQPSPCPAGHVQDLHLPARHTPPPTHPQVQLWTCSSPDPGTLWLAEVNGDLPQYLSPTSRGHHKCSEASGSQQGNPEESWIVTANLLLYSTCLTQHLNFC